MSQDHHRHKLKRSRNESVHETDERTFEFKIEPPDDASENVSSSLSRRNESSKRRFRSRSPRGAPDDLPPRERRRRLREPQVLKEEEGHKKGGRLHSPVLLKEEERPHNPRFNSSRRTREEDFKGNLSQSGLLGKNENTVTQKQRANFGLSGKLAEDTNTFKGVVIKYNEPEDARKPTQHWRLYVFKGTETLPILHIHRQSGFLIGRDRKIADIPMDHPSISKQHAVLQYRLVRGLVRLYLIDLESANGTYLNNQRIEPRRYYELIEKDLIKFGYSSREYVVMTADLEDDDKDEGAMPSNEQTA